MSADLDATARALAVREFVRPVVIEAGAGTGKTRTLVARIGTWLLGPGWQVARAELERERAARGDGAPLAGEVAVRAAEGVVAITFTDAAAAEMAARVDRLLSQAAAGTRADDLDDPPESAGDELPARAAALLASSPRLRISTIHGFCHRLLAEAPLDAGLHPGFEVDADGERASELATSLLLGRLRAGDAALVELLTSGVEPPALLDALVALAAGGVESSELARDPFDEPALGRRFTALAEAIDRLTVSAAPLLSGRRVASIADGVEALNRLRQTLRGAAPTAERLAAIADELASSGTQAKKILGDWAKGKFGKTEREALGPELGILATAATRLAREHGALAALDPPRHRLARRALAPPLAELTARKRSQGIVSFDDLLERATRLLTERPGVRTRVRRSMRQLLVDEFQDTDRRQCDLLRALVLAGSEAPPPGLFVVGDPKQSIYGWRSADLAAYAGFLAELDAAGALNGRLEINFRSAPPILAEIERALGPVLIEQPGLQAGFQPLRAAPRRQRDRGFEAQDRAPVEYWLADDPGAERALNSARATELEAAAIARDLRQLVDGGSAAWGDFALLLRSRGDLETFLDALRKAGAPYVVQKDRSYYRRREVIDTLAGVRAILDPLDLLALVAFLRSPFVGVPDAAWLPLWRAGFPAAMIAARGEHGLEAVLAAIAAAAAEPPAALPPSARAPGWADSLAHAVRAMAALRADFDRCSASEWVERLRARLVLEPIAAARFLGRFGLANLERLFLDLEQRLAAEPDSARALATLRRAVSEESPAEEGRPPEEVVDAVSVMTIHTAKGLQFRHVYIVQAQRRPRGRAGANEPAAKIGPPATAGRGRELSLFGSPTPGWSEVELRRSEVATSEAARLLYVATTRAIDRLVISGRWSADDDESGEGAARADRPDIVPSFAELLSLRRANAPKLSLAEPVAADEQGALWRLLVPGESPAGSSSHRDAVELPPPQDVGALARRRAEAHARAARARIAAASALFELDDEQQTKEGEVRALDHGRSRSSLKGQDEPRCAGSGEVRAAARARGVALHRALELSTIADDDEAAWRAAAHDSYLCERPAADASELAELDDHLTRLTSSLLWQQLSFVSSDPARILARELPLLMAVDPENSSALAPIDGYVGTLDLLYRDTATGEIVVADFKTDRLSDETEVAGVVEHYRSQLERYGGAVRSALGLAAPPRLELWLLALDRVVRVEPR